MAIMCLQLVSSATLDEETGEVTLTFLEQWDESKEGDAVSYQPTKRVTVKVSPAVVENIIEI